MNELVYYQDYGMLYRYWYENTRKRRDRKQREGIKNFIIYVEVLMLVEATVINSYDI